MITLKRNLHEFLCLETLAALLTSRLFTENLLLDWPIPQMKKGSREAALFFV